MDAAWFWVDHFLIELLGVVFDSFLLMLHFCLVAPLSKHPLRGRNETAAALFTEPQTKPGVKVGRSSRFDR